MSTPILLEDRSVVAVSGPEARPFLQGLMTNDVEKLGPAIAIYAALLTPQGKILFDFLVAEGDGAILLDCHRDGAEALVRRLSMYRLRAKIQIEIRHQLVVFSALSDKPSERGITFADPRLPALGSRTIGARAEMPAVAAGVATYHDHRLALGVPEGPDFGSDRIFALDAGLDELHAISFDKGCYVGQELTARMKHRGTARKRLLPIATADGSPLPARDTPVNADGHVLGEIVSTYGTTGFALIRLDRLEECSAVPPRAGGSPVHLSRPGWLTP